MVRLSSKRGSVYSMFLNSNERLSAEMHLKQLMYENYCFYGLFENAERQMLCVFREYFEPEKDDFPIGCITFGFKKECLLSHRDFLGALMALGIKRETVGDIVIQKGIAQIAVSLAVKDVIIGNVRKIGSVGVKYKENFPGTLTIVQNFKEISGTVASMRLDAVAGLALNLSRGKTAEIIKSIGSEVNYEKKYDCSVILSEGDIFSVKGFGKFKISETLGMTKKGRIHITVLKYC